MTTQKLETKKWYQSKTVWAGVLAAAVGVITAIEGQLEAGTTITFFGVLNIILRAVTTTKIN
jgi:hypothetical protein